MRPSRSGSPTAPNTASRCAGVRANSNASTGFSIFAPGIGVRERLGHEQREALRHRERRQAPQQARAPASPAGAQRMCRTGHASILCGAAVSREVAEPSGIAAGRGRTRPMPGALSVQITACGAIRSRSSSALTRTPRKFGAPDPAVKTCEPHTEQNPRRVAVAAVGARFRTRLAAPEWLDIRRAKEGVGRAVAAAEFLASRGTSRCARRAARPAIDSVTAPHSIGRCAPPRQAPCRRAMKARRSNSITSCSFLSSAPWSGGIALVGSRLCSTSSGMSSLQQQLEPVEQLAGRRLLLEAGHVADLVEHVHRLGDEGLLDARDSGRR